MPVPEYVPPEDPADDFPIQEPADTDARIDALLRWSNDAEARIAAALALHEPLRLCVAHHQQHECTEPHGYAYRCYSCARTNRLACRTWRALTGKDRPDAD